MIKIVGGARILRTCLDYFKLDRVTIEERKLLYLDNYFTWITAGASGQRLSYYTQDSECYLRPQHLYTGPCQVFCKHYSPFYYSLGQRCPDNRGSTVQWIGQLVFLAVYIYN